VRLEGLGQLKQIHLIGTRTRDLPVCSIVPQPTTLPRAPTWYVLQNTMMAREMGASPVKSGKNRRLRCSENSLYT
jgi:hypothetical protein